MSGFFTNGMPGLDQLLLNSGAVAMDTGLAAGANPESVGISPDRLGLLISYVTNNVDKTTVAGSRYYRQWVVSTPITLTGVAFLVGGTGGTDNAIVELHDSNGVLLATSALAGVLIGTANTWQELPFTATVTIPAGTYYIVVQSNGTTAKLRVYQSAGLTTPTGSAIGTFGTSAAITPPTTYTAGLGPVVFPY